MSMMPVHIPCGQDPDGVLKLEATAADGSTAGSDGYASGDEHNALVPLEVRTARATLRRKYRQLERALEEDQMLFEVRGERQRYRGGKD